MRALARVLCAASILAGTVAGQAPPSQQPSFRAGVELVTVDVQALDKDGRPVEGLAAEDFRLEVDGKPRPVAVARFVRFIEASRDETGRPAQAAPSPAAPERGFGTNEGVTAGRLIALVVDQGNMTRGGGRVAMEAAARFLDQLTPVDRVGLLTIPIGPSVDFTNDFQQVKDALLKVVGGGAHQEFGSRGPSLAESFAFVTGQERRLWNQAIQLDCAMARTEQELQMCIREMESLALNKVAAAKSSAGISLQALRNLLRRLATVEGPKQLVLIGQSLVTGTTFGDLDLMTDVNEVGTLAQRARVTMSVLHMDRAFLEAFDVKERTPTRTIVEDSRLLSDGLVQTAGAAGGAYYNLAVRLDPAFNRIARETSAGYEVGFETIEADRDGKPHKIDVKIGRPGITVRARRSFVATPGATAAEAGAPASAPSPRERVARILESPVPRTAMPIRLRAHALSEPGGTRVRVLLAADLGRDEKAPAELSVGYFLRAPGGAIAGQAFETVEVQPTDRKAFYYSTVLMVPPGEYLLRLAAVDASDRAGVVEVPVTAQFETSAGTEISDVLLIEPDVRAGGKMKMNVDGRVSGRELSVYVELRAPAQTTTASGGVAPSEPSPAQAAAATPAAAPTVRFDVINPADGTAMVGRQVRATAESDEGRWFAETTLDISSLAPGRYTLRVAPVDPATGETTKGMTRAIQISRFGADGAAPSTP